MSHSHSVKEYPGQIAGIAAIATAVGAVGGLLMAPKRGAETRKQIRSKATMMRGKMKDAAQKDKKLATKATDRAASTMKAATGRAKDTASKVKEDTKATSKEVKSDMKQNARETKD